MFNESTFVPCPNCDSRLIFNEYSLRVGSKKHKGVHKVSCINTSCKYNGFALPDPDKKANERLQRDLVGYLRMKLDIDPQVELY